MGRGMGHTQVSATSASSVILVCDVHLIKRLLLTHIPILILSIYIVSVHLQRNFLS